MNERRLPRRPERRPALHAGVAALVAVAAGILARHAPAEAQPPAGEPAAERAADAAGAPGADSAPVDLVFAGGSATEYVEAIRAASGVLNVLVAPEAALVHVEPIELRRVGVQSALYLLDGVRQERLGRYFELHVTSIRSQQPSATSPVYRLDAVSAPIGLSGEPSRVWSIAALLDDLEPEDILTAIETALDLLSEGGEAAQMRFHRETGLLIARGHPEQLAAIQSIIDELTGAQREAHREQDSKTEIVQLRNELAGRQDAAEQLTLELTQAQARNELVARAVEQGEVEAAALRTEVRRREDMIEELERRVRDLEAAIGAARAEKRG